MNIVIRKSKNGYTADLRDLPGSPPCGNGDTKAEAIADLFRVLLQDDREGYNKNRSFKWLSVKMDLSEVKIEEAA